MRGNVKMCDFRFSGDGGFWTYSETCRRAKEDGIAPIENPGPALLELVQKVLDRIMPIYVDLIPLSEKPLRLRGVFLYDPSVQPADLKSTFGVAVPLDAEDALIGLSKTAADMRSFDFASYVFLHEVSHICSTSGHDEEFAKTLNAAAIGFFAKSDAARMDSVAVRRFHLVKGWQF